MYVEDKKEQYIKNILNNIWQCLFIKRFYYWHKKDAKALYDRQRLTVSQVPIHIK